MTRLQAIQAQYQGIHQRHYHWGQVVPAIPSRVGQVSGQEVAQLYHSQKFVKEVNPAEVRQTRMIKGDPDISGRVSHSANP